MLRMICICKETVLKDECISLFKSIDLSCKLWQLKLFFFLHVNSLYIDTVVLFTDGIEATIFWGYAETWSFHSVKNKS